MAKTNRKMTQSAYFTLCRLLQEEFSNEQPHHFETWVAVGKYLVRQYGERLGVDDIAPSTIRRAMQDADRMECFALTSKPRGVAASRRVVMEQLKSMQAEFQSLVDLVESQANEIGELKRKVSTVQGELKLVANAARNGKPLRGGLDVVGQ